MSVPVDDATVAVQISTHSLFSVKHKFQIPGDLPMRGSGGGLPRVKLNLLSHMHVCGAEDGRGCWPPSGMVLHGRELC